MQLRACFSGAVSVCGKARCCRSMNNRVVRARRRLSMLAREASRARRTSTGENRLKTSSPDSGSSQNCKDQKASWFQDSDSLTPRQYGSSAGIASGSDNLKIPCLKTSFESELPISKIQILIHCSRLDSCFRSIDMQILM